MISLIRGSDRTIRVMMKKSSGEPLDLTGCTAIKAIMLDEENAAAELSAADDEIVFVNRGGGIIDLKMAAEFTATLRVGERQTFQLEAVIGTDTVRVNLYEALTVEAKIEDQ